jgi:hypothetical protein
VRDLSCVFSDCSIRISRASRTRTIFVRFHDARYSRAAQIPRPLGEGVRSACTQRRSSPSPVLSDEAAAEADGYRVGPRAGLEFR